MNDKDLKTSIASQVYMDLAFLDFGHRLSLQRVECPVLRVWPVLARAWEWDMRCVQWMVPGQAGRGEWGEDSRCLPGPGSGSWLGQRGAQTIGRIPSIMMARPRPRHWPPAIHNTPNSPSLEMKLILYGEVSHWHSILFYTASPVDKARIKEKRYHWFHNINTFNQSFNLIV